MFVVRRQTIVPKMILIVTGAVAIFGVALAQKAGLTLADFQIGPDTVLAIRSFLGG